MSDNTKSVGQILKGETKKYFTLDEANKSLVYVGKVLQDIVTFYRQARRLQEQGKPKEDEFDVALSNLHHYLGESETLGIIIVDLEIGVVDFPAMFEGREIALRWSLRVPGGINSWREAGMQNVSKLKELHLITPKK